MFANGCKLNIRYFTQFELIAFSRLICIDMQ